MTTAFIPTFHLRSLAIYGMVFGLIVFLPVPVVGSSTQIWELNEYEDFLLGEFENVSLLQSGALSPVPQLTSLFDSDQPVIWTVAASVDGTTYIGTGHQGKIYRLDRDGKVNLFWTAPEIEIFALAAGPDGEVYAGTSPNGKLYRITSQGLAKEIFDPEQTYIWSLVVVPAPTSERHNGPTVYMATGSEGKIYKVKASGQGRVFAETKQRHVVSLALDASGQLLAGTDPNGIVYRIDPKGKVFALHDADQPEVRSLQVAPNGDIYAAAMGSIVSQINQRVSSFASTSVGATATIAVNTESTGPTPPKISPDVQSALNVVQPVVAYPGMERSVLLRIRLDQGVEKLWSSSEENILAVGILTDETVVGFDNTNDLTTRTRILFATDQKGRIYELGKSRRGTQRQVHLVTESGHQQITQLARDGEGLLVASAHSAGLSRFKKHGKIVGVYKSAIHDAKAFARWGRLTWEGKDADLERVAIVTRSGNSAVPDASWSEWSEEIRGVIDLEGAGTFAGNVKSPPARYIQWKVTLARKNQITPLLRRVRLVYLPRNSPPHITDLKVTALQERSTVPSVSSTTSMSSGSKTDSAYSITVAASGSSAPTTAKATPQTVLGGDSRKNMKISWEAGDPDGDKLTSVVSFREIEDSAWKVIKKDIEGSYVFLDSETLADGVYRFQVVVSDRTENPTSVSYEAKEISEPVLVDHTSPSIGRIEINRHNAVAFEAIDRDSALVIAEYAIDAGEWIPIYPVDGILDSRRESFLIRLEDLPSTEHLLTVRVRDRSGNSGLGKVSIPNSDQQ